MSSTRSWRSPITAPAWSWPAGVAGLGLTVVRQLLDSADGRLEVCEAPDGGTCVRVTFGRAQSAPR